ncbi:MAG: CotH kinase family protein [Vallitalea sp.]|jgi:spore coat protein H|nr:CotH kinase family protein [Vallitalea sp.]
MRQWMKRSLLIIIVGISLYCGFLIYRVYTQYNNDSSEIYDEDTWVNPLNNTSITEKIEIYKDDEQKEVDKIYLTILDTDKEKYSSFEEFINSSSDTKNNIKVYFQHGDSKALKLFEEEPNATIQLKGKVSNKSVQKSYKIKLYDKTGLWRNQNIINLNKDYNDYLRIRNKLSFDYYKIIPSITSFRTRFVRLYVKDKFSNSSNDEFIDYGLYTQIEQPNKLFLKNHGLDPNGHLYKAEDFKFFLNDQYIKDKKDIDYSKKEFERVLEIRGNNNHTKLIEMLQAVNDMNRDINEVIDIYFDKENYLTWIGTNILFDNYKTNNSNFLLYSPVNSSKWYFMPWDYDKAWGIDEDRASWEKGLAIYFDNKLHQRFFQKDGNIEALNKKIEELSKIITKEQTKSFIDRYYNILLSNITKLPDIKYLPITIKELNHQLEKLPDVTSLNKNYYSTLIENPMPFYLHEPKYVESKWVFDWDSSYDIQGDKVSYTFEISRDKYFNDIYMVVNDISESECEVSDLDRGVYYFRVRARDSKDNLQIGYDVYRDEFGEEFYGIRRFFVD